MEGKEEDTWAQLVCTTDLDCQPFLINQNKFSIGRAKACDICLGDNKLVSSTHCYIEKRNDETVWLYDNSTNGTLLNLKVKLSKGECQKLNHGDEFFVVYKRNNEDLNIGYVYQDLKELANEEESDEQTQEYNDLADATLVDDELNLIPSPVPPCKRPQTICKDEPPAKRIKPNVTQPASGEPSNTSPASSGIPDDTPTSDDTQSTKATEEMKDGKKETTEDSKGKTESKKDDGLAETLMCIICQEILHDCISLQPCMHSFCSGCYSDWMDRSSECPSCRLKVERINKNHIVNNLVEAYLKENPDKKRPEEDIKELESKNKITRDMLYPGKKKKIPSSSDCDSNDYADTDPESDSDDDNPPIPVHAFGFGGLFNPATIPGGLFGVPFGTIRPAKTVCRQCPEYKEPIRTDPVTGKVGDANCASGDNSKTGDTGPCDGAGPSTSGVIDSCKTMATPPPFVCAPNQNHYMCACCLQPMPDRRNDAYNNANIPPQQCSLCKQGYCHAYWGCRKPDCDGCLAKFKDLNFNKKCLAALVMDNFYESDVLKNYLEAKNISIKDLLLTCLQRKESGVYAGRATYAEIHLNSNSVLCYACGLRNFKELIYQYRSDIPKEDLPDAVTKRPDCYWGKSCRTQKNKPQHAMNFNHICDQTRTT